MMMVMMLLQWSDASIMPHNRATNKLVNTLTGRLTFDQCIFMVELMWPDYASDVKRKSGGSLHL